MRRIRVLSLVLGFVLSLTALVSALAAQRDGTHPSRAKSEQEQQHEQEKTEPSKAVPAEINGENPSESVASNAESGGQVAETTHKEAEEGEQEAELRQSPAVKWLGGVVGLGSQGAYWLALGLNFAVLALIVIVALRSRLPAMFRARTSNIQQAMEEARKASTEANRRLTAIEERLSRLDAEITVMRQQAEQEAKTEEQKIMAGAEEERRKIVETAEQEIISAAKLARRDLTAYAASLAVALAEEQIRIDQGTDEALVRSFADKLPSDLGAGKKASGDGH
jgi:F-type H+-transporting ATPase subunit b